MIRTVCEKNMCAGCMACLEKCKKNAIMIVDDLYAYNAVIDEVLCINCGECEHICPNVSPVEKRRPIEWHQGWAGHRTRERSSSGGAASAIIRAFIENGGYAAACLLINGKFVFHLTNNPEEAQRFAGSKYVKSDPGKIYGTIDKKLRFGERVLFIGLPCQVAALKKITGENENLYTIDLICHGTPSPRLLEMFLKEKGVAIRDVDEVKFRKKNTFGILAGGRALEPDGLKDMYTYAFLTGLDYTENCYLCSYAELARVSDLTLGDSWGSELEMAEQKRGISLILCQTAKGKELLWQSKMIIKAVDIEKAVQANSQLNRPMVKPEKREIFFTYIDHGFHTAIKKSCPKYYIKRKLKVILEHFG